MKCAVIACAAAILSAATPARADSTITPADKIEITGALDISLSSGSVADPVIIAVDAFYGLTPDIDVGLVHTSPQVSGFLALRDGGLCIGETLCPSTYDSPGVLGRYQLLRGEGLAALVETGLVVVTFSEPTFALSAKLGLRARYRTGSLFIDASPNLLIAVAGRTFEDDTGTEVDFNKTNLNLPIDVGFKSGPFEAFVQVGLSGPLDNFVDALLTPVGFGVRYELNERLGVLGWFSFRDIFNTQPEFEFDVDIRSAGISATFQL